MRSGLDNVVAAETVLSHVDGEAGRLIIRGLDLEDLAGHATFEDATAMLWDGIVKSAGDLKAELSQARVDAFARFKPLAANLKGLTTVEAMRLLLSSIPDGAYDREPTDVLAAAGVAAAFATRVTQGEDPIVPDANLSHAADVLRMIRGKAGDAEEIAAFETYLVTVMDHGLNASTFAARVVASTAAGLPSAVVGALCALKGPLHGGAPGPVLDMFDGIEKAGNADAWIADALKRGERLMGFGHRVYRVRDPRANVLKTTVAKLKGRANRIAFAEAIEAAALRALRDYKTERRLDTNVEFYTALLLEALNIPREAFTPVFALARTSGWIAHIREQETNGRLIRPQSRYVGTWPVKAA
ncbi:MAG: citrate synthase/methylcitrate synthase [Alphaproteobacteria bacterium]|nr:citrate synthase/methylcitrate synthase [Alphaproteobacteria bacterium]